MNNQSNFTFLIKDFPILANLGESAEYYLHTDTSVSVSKVRLFGEKLVEILFNELHLRLPDDDKFSNRLRLLNFDGTTPKRIIDLLHIIRSKGNHAVHNVGKVSLQDATTVLDIAFRLGKWLQNIYGESFPKEVEDLEFKIPPKIDIHKALSDLEGKYSELEKALKETIEKNQQLEVKLTDEQTVKLKDKIRKALERLPLNEAETRLLIDKQIRDAGWEVDTDNLNFKKKQTLPVEGKHMAIAEWRCGSLWADYAFFIGKKLYALVEAKPLSKDIVSDLKQAQVYAESILLHEEIAFLGDWGKYKVPFLFSTNGREYNPQIETKSGIWFLDTRKPINHSRALHGWYSPQGLVDVFNKDIEKANAGLEIEPFDYLVNKRGLGLRPYQVEAIQAVEEQLFDGKKKSVLLAMATGTGKTRTIVGLCYRLLKKQRFKRILFLVDRNVLGEQSKTVFENAPVESSKRLGDIIKLAGFEENQVVYLDNLKNQGKPDDGTRVYFTSVQGMVARIFNNANPEDVPAVNTYDCIIVDEAHRGYLLDKEMDSDQLEFRNQMDFVSKYRRVLDYFDAFKVGLTATPAKHTTDIFGFPVYIYSYRRAVLEGFLVDHEPPFIIKTILSDEGIKWEKGEKPKLVSNTGEVKELAELDDELKLEIENFNKRVLAPAFNRTVCEELVKHLNPDSSAKTLIFAVNNDHADTIVTELKKAFVNAGIETEENAIMKITGSVYKYEEWVRRYKNETSPNIVVTVDLLTTGVDVPEITNLVFMRRINSRILYEQMMGRATRLCPDIGKETFKIFDAVRLYEALSDYSDMKPVVTNVNQPLSTMVAELAAATNDEGYKKLLEQIVAKVQRRKQLVNNDKLKNEFRQQSGGQSPDDFVNLLQSLNRNESFEFIQKSARIFDFFEQLRRERNYGILLYEGVDSIKEVERGYGVASRPEDYLEKFREYILSHVNENEALKIVVTRPQSLTRAELKNIIAELDSLGFTTAYLNTAWKQAKNEEIVADLIAFIRTMALGSVLIPKEERISQAMKKVYALRSWSAIQRDWLVFIEKRLKKEELLVDKSLFDSDEFLKSKGGFKRMNAAFQNEGEQILTLINEQLYADAG